MTCSLLIPEVVAEKTLKHLGKLAKKAGVEVTPVPGHSVRYRLAAHHYTRQGHSYVKHVVDTDQVLICARITIGDMPRFNGHTFLGKIVHTAAGNLLAMGRTDVAVIPPEWREAKPTCDHCATKRKRAETFIIQAPDGAIKRVGRNCLADFLKSSPEQLIALSVFEDGLFKASSNNDEDSYSEGGGYGGLWQYSPLRLLACAFASVESTKGVYISREMADRLGHECSRTTADDADFLACEKNASHPNGDARRDWKERQPTPDNWGMVVGALLWLEESTDNSDYMHNLRTAMLNPAVMRQTKGLIASVTAAYARHTGEAAKRRAEAALKAALPPSKHIGAIKQRLDLEVTLQGVHGYIGSFGPSNVVRMIADDGAVLVAFCTGEAPSPEAVGKRLAIRATVTKHDFRKGEAQTVVNRLAFKVIDNTSQP
jgi:hypothetical protein